MSSTGWRVGLAIGIAVLATTAGCGGQDPAGTSPTVADGIDVAAAGDDVKTALARKPRRSKLLYSATLNWTPPALNDDGSALADATGYVVYYGTSPDGMTNTAAISGTLTTSATVSGLRAGTYYFAMATVGGMGQPGPASNAVSITVP